MNDQGEINDKAKLHHADHSKAFSTIIFAGMTYLQENPTKFLGIDGSNNARAYMYYRCIQNNFDYLTQHFKIYGVNYFVRILRKAKDEDLVSPIDSQDVIAVPQLIQAKEHIPHEKYSLRLNSCLFSGYSQNCASYFLFKRSWRCFQIILLYQSLKFYNQKSYWMYCELIPINC